MLLMVGNYTDLGFFASGASRRKLSRRTIATAADSRKTVPHITTTGAVRGIISAKGRDSMTGPAGPPADMTSRPSSGPGSSASLAVNGSDDRMEA